MSTCLQTGRGRARRRRRVLEIPNGSTHLSSLVMERTHGNRLMYVRAPVHHLSHPLPNPLRRAHRHYPFGLSSVIYDKGFDTIPSLFSSLQRHQRPTSAFSPLPPPSIPEQCCTQSSSPRRWPLSLPSTAFPWSCVVPSEFLPNPFPFPLRPRLTNVSIPPSQESSSALDGSDWQRWWW